MGATDDFATDDATASKGKIQMRALIPHHVEFVREVDDQNILSAYGERTIATVGNIGRATDRRKSDHIIQHSR